MDGARRKRCLHENRRLQQGRCIAAGGAEFCAFLRCFSGKREKDQVSIGCGWWQWTQQASARIHSTVRSYFPMSNRERWIGPAQVTGHPSHASPPRTAFRSRVLRRRARGGSVAGERPVNKLAGTREQSASRLSCRIACEAGVFDRVVDRVPVVAPYQLLGSLPCVP